MPPERANLSVNRATFAGRVDENGDMVAAIPVNESGELAGTLHVSYTADRVLEVIWEVEPNAVDPIDFRAWQRRRNT